MTVWTQGWYAGWDGPPLTVPTDVPTPFDQLVREGAQVVCRAEIWFDGQLRDELPVEDGQVAYDTSAAITRSCDVTLLGPVPETPTSILAPSGAVLHLFRGARDWTGEVIEFPVGVYGFETSEFDRADRLARITGFDYARYVQDARWEHPYEIQAGTNLAVAIDQALSSRLPAALRQPLNHGTVDHTVPSIVWGEERDNDPWDDLVSLAASAGLDLRFDREGRPELVRIPDPDDAPVVWDFTVGQEPTYLSASRQLTGRPYNVVVARGEPPDDGPIVEATAEDDDPNSGSYVGLYRRPFFATSPYTRTEAQARDAAEGELNRRKGLSEQVTIGAVPHPGRELGQVVIGHDPELHIDARYVLDQVTLPLRASGPMVLTTRRRRL